MQFEHALPGEEYLPAAQAVHWDAPTALDEPAPHMLHSEEPANEYEY